MTTIKSSLFKAAIKGSFSAVGMYFATPLVLATQVNGGIMELTTPLGE